MWSVGLRSGGGAAAVMGSSGRCASRTRTDPDCKVPALRQAQVSLEPRVAAHARFATGDNQLAMQVTLVQPLGDKMDVYVATDRHPHAVAQIDAFASVKAGDSISVYFDLERVHFFEPGELGKRVADNRSRNSAPSA